MSASIHALSEKGLTKIVDLSSYWDGVDVPVSVVAGNEDMLVKKAAHEDIQAFVDNDLVPEEGFIYLHINAMGAGEYYGANRNGDYFPEEQLKKYHHTFSENAHIFRHHVNKDPAKAIGKVIFSIYNDRMHRVEVIARVSTDLAKDVVDAMAKGEFPKTSMGCKTPYDRCSICGNEARTTAAYCDHLRYDINRIMPDGKKVMALNVAPLKFFDLSVVIRPADVTSSVLSKVASYGGIASAILAEELGIDEPASLYKKASSVKVAAIKKMADLVKVVEGDVISTISPMTDIKNNARPMEDEKAELLRIFPLADILKSFAELGAAPSISFLSQLLMHKAGAHVRDGMGAEIQDLLVKHGPSSVDPMVALGILDNVDGFPIEEGEADPVIMKLILDSSDDSMFPEAIEKRAYVNHLGYYVPGQPVAQQAAQQDPYLKNYVLPSPEGGFWKNLLAVGAAALLGRMYVSSMIDDKVNRAKMDMMAMQLQAERNAAQGYVKTASAAASTIDMITILDVIGA